MNSIPSAIVSFFVNSIWQIPLIAGVGWAAGRGLKKLSPEAEHSAWVSTLTVAALLPVFPLLRSLPAWPHLLHTSEGNAAFTLVAAQGGELNAKGVLILPTVLILALMFVYLASILYLAARFFWSCHWTKVLVRDARPASLTPEQEAIWRSCKHSFCLDSTRILSSRQITGPVTVGFREPVLLVPAGFSSSCASQDFLAAMAHECAHIKRRDFKKNLLYEAATLLLAFHPVLWFIKSRIAQTREMICDGMATESLIDSRRYTQSLLRLAGTIAGSSRPSISQAIGIFDADILEKRIMMMNRKKRHNGAGTHFGLIPAAALSLLLIAAAASAMAFVIEPADSSQVAAQEKPYGHVYRVGKDVSAPVPTKVIDAKFPKAALASKDKFQGVCLIGLVVDASGNPRNVHVVHSLRPDFDANAIKAVQQYHFTPAMRSGTPVAVAVNVEVNFKWYY